MTPIAPPPSVHPLIAASQGTGFSIPNALGSNSDLGQIITNVANGIMQLAIPVAAGLYIYAGVTYLLAGAKPELVSRAKKTFWYTTIGLIVIFIGGGFVDLIKSVLQLGS